MMKIGSIVFSIILFWTVKCFSGIDDVLPPNEIFAFTQATCSHCWKAKDYVKENYPDLKIQWREISEEKNWELFLVCANKFKLDRSRLGTPLFCMGSNYIMGWGSAEQKNFDEYVKDFNPQPTVSE